MNAYILLPEVILIAVSSALSTIILLRALHLLFFRLNSSHNGGGGGGEGGMAPSLKIYLVSLFILSVSLMVGSWPLAVKWNPKGYNDPYLIFWCGVWSGSLIPAAPVGVLFLMLDRLLLLIAPLSYSSRIKNFLALLGAFLTVAMAGANMAFYLTTNIDTPSNKGKQIRATILTKEFFECWTFACLSSSASLLFYALNRMVVAVPNFFLSITFMVILYKKRQPGDQTSKRRMGDRIAFISVILLFFFDLVPSAANLISTYAFDINLSTIIGPYRQMTASLNALSVGLIDTRILTTLSRRSPTMITQPSAIRLVTRV